MRIVGSKVTLRKLPETTVMKSGLIIPSIGMKVTPKGVILDAPEEYVENGVLRKCPLKKGDTVIYIAHGASHLDDTPDVYMCDIVHVLGVLDENETAPTA